MDPSGRVRRLKEAEDGPAGGDRGRGPRVQHRLEGRQQQRGRCGQRQERVGDVEQQLRQAKAGAEAVGLGGVVEGRGDEGGVPQQPRGGVGIEREAADVVRNGLCECMARLGGRQGNRARASSGRVDCPPPAGLPSMQKGQNKRRAGTL